MHALAKRYYAAAVVPYDKAGCIDEDAYRRQIRYYLQPRFAEVGGFIANAEAGEVYYLSTEEKERLVEIAREEIDGRIPLFSGIFELTTKNCVESAKRIKGLGVDGLFLMPPAGCADLVVSWKSDKYPEYWLDQIKEIDDAVDLPIIGHPVASATPQWGIGVAGESARLICEEVPNIIGWKGIYNYEGLRKLWIILREMDREVAIMAAGGRFFHEYLAHGMMDGTVSGSWVYGLEPMLDHIDAWKMNDVERARHIWYDGGLGALHDYIYSDYSRLHLRYKIAAWVRDLIPSPLARAPMPKPQAAEVRATYDLMKAAGIEVIPESRLSDF